MTDRKVLFGNLLNGEFIQLLNCINSVEALVKAGVYFGEYGSAEDEFKQFVKDMKFLTHSTMRLINWCEDTSGVKAVKPTLIIGAEEVNAAITSFMESFDWTTQFETQVDNFDWNHVLNAYDVVTDGALSDIEVRVDALDERVDNLGLELEKVPDRIDIYDMVDERIDEKSLSKQEVRDIAHNIVDDRFDDVSDRIRITFVR